MKTKKRSKDKVILITGGATGIGRAIALEFAKRKAHLVINYLTSEREVNCTIKKIKKVGGCAIKIRADVTKSNEVKTMFEIIKKKFGQLDILVNNAGWSQFVNFNDLDKISEKMYQRIMDVNLKGVFLCSKEAVKLMHRVKDALIINISSTSGIGGVGSNIVYCAAKGAVITMTKSLPRMV